MRAKNLVCSLLVSLCIMPAIALAGGTASAPPPGPTVVIPDGQGGGTIGGLDVLTMVPSAYDFVDATARDEYFDGDPGPATPVDGTRIHLQSTGYIQRYVTGTGWVNETALTKGPSGSSIPGVSSDGSNGINVTGGGTFGGGVSAPSVTIGGSKVVVQSNCSTITEGLCIDTDDMQIYRWDGDSVENVTGTGTDEIIYQADCSSINNGLCIDTDDGAFYYWDGDSVESVGGGTDDQTAAEVSVTDSGGLTDQANVEDYLAENRRAIDALEAVDNWTEAENAAAGYLSSIAIGDLPTTGGAWLASSINPTFGIITYDSLVTNVADGNHYISAINSVAITATATAGRQAYYNGVWYGADGTDWDLYFLHSESAASDFPILNQNTTGTSAGLSAQYIDWNATSGGDSIANKPTIMTTDTTRQFIVSDDCSLESLSTGDICAEY